MPKKLILIIGAPGAGKSTQAELLAQKYPEKITSYSTGELLKKETQSGSAVGRIISDYFYKGHLVPSTIIIDVVLDAIKAAPTDVVVIDGFPRKERQVKLFGDVLFSHKDIELVNVIELSVSDIAGKERFTGSEEIYENELQAYKETIAEVEKYYKEHDLLKVVDAEAPLDETFRQIEVIIQDKI
ncbi:adenylate kinase [Sulfurovum sp. NBC37-1]|uniref:adenylate kinase n=1 Tax=Sulfurovum sp. (strain NBC37-1) TaxID=387093 RepID=UPI0001587851|nr:adenylate kinase [Sulfurovum sp. NBC37-1]BAF71371.1 adenylate kinase [Sulfurovum sp. NBC37-1]